MQARQSDAEYITSRVVAAPWGCWQWMYGLSESGYALTKGRRERRVHRLSYRVFSGDIPEGLVIDHICRNRACVNPAHLRAVTNRENTLSGHTLPARNVKKTHCAKGHELVKRNGKDGEKGWRDCRVCKAAASSAAWKARRLAVNRRKTQCAKGHELEPDPWRIGKRMCMTCYRARQSRYQKIRHTSANPTTEHTP